MPQLSTSLEPIAMAALDTGRLSMEAGAGAKAVEAMVEMVARGLGAERVDLRIGYASISITIGIGETGITRMRKVGPLGVNQRLSQGIWELTKRVSQRELGTEETRKALALLPGQTPHHAPWAMAVAVGLACAAFGRLLGVDWLGAGSVFLASTAGQYVRKKLLMRHVNGFICTALIAFLSSLLAGLGAYRAGSETYTTAMVASVLLLVPGVPAVNAQSDILDGHPTLGSARAVTVAMTLVFMAAGLWIGRAAFSLWHNL